MSLNENRFNAESIAIAPDDILMDVFEFVVMNISDPIPRTQQAIQLSAVCRRWRGAAVATPRLWNHICFYLEQNWDRQIYFRDHILPRVKHIPALVTLYAMTKDTVRLAMKCGLHEIKVIKWLGIELNELDNAFLLASDFQPLVVGTLHISCIHPMEGIGGSEFNLGALLPKFQQLTTLVVSCITKPIFSIPSTPSTLRNLNIQCHRESIDIISILRSFINLEYLRIRGGIRTTIDIGSTVAPSLKYLSLVKVYDFDWMQDIACPQLREFSCIVHPDPHLVAFIYAHPTIVKLEIHSWYEQAIPLGEAAPHLTHLTIHPPLDDLLCSYNCNKVPLLHLKSLKICTTGWNPLTLKEFEAFVCARCLPIRHPRSLARDLSEIIPSVSIWSKEKYTPAWYNSSLFATCTHTAQVYDDPEANFIPLAWPEWN